MIANVSALLVALGTLFLAGVTLYLAVQTAALAREGRRADRLRFTDKAIHQTLGPEMRDALNNLQSGDANETDAQYAARMFAFAPAKLGSPVNTRQEPLKSYMFAVGLYMSLFDLESAYGEANVIDEPLYFSQCGETIVYVYFLLKDYLFEPKTLVVNSRITKFATRAFLQQAEALERPALPQATVDFFAVKARKYYRGDRTEAAIVAATQSRPGT